MGRGAWCAVVHGATESGWLQELVVGRGGLECCGPWGQRVWVAPGVGGGQGSWCAAVRGVSKSRTRLSCQQQLRSCSLNELMDKVLLFLHKNFMG